jgi:hypothetical protein
VSSRRGCNLRITSATSPQPRKGGLTVAIVRPRQGRDHLAGFPVRRFHLRLPTVSRFAGPGIEQSTSRRY